MSPAPHARRSCEAPRGVGRLLLACVAVVLLPGTVPSRVRDAARPVLAHNAGAADTSNVDDLAPMAAFGYGLAGRGVRVGIWDVGGVLESHQDLAGRVRVADGTMATDHATHAAGTILGDGSGNAAARGMAPSAAALSYSWVDAAARLAQVGARLSASNHAYGPALGWFDNAACDDRPTWVSGSAFSDAWLGKYGQNAADIDAVAHAGDDVVVWSAGNSRRDVLPSGTAHYHHPSCGEVYDDDHAAQDGYGTMGGAALAKNAIAVGAVGDLSADPIEPSDIRPLYFSGFGPTDDGRIKPDLVASGSSVLSTVAGADDAYASFSGTSSSSAVVTGAIALLVEHYRALNQGLDPRAAEVKAILVQTAVDDAHLPGPDAETGYGLLDARAAAEFVASDASATSGKHVRVGVLEASEQAFVTASAVAQGTDLRVTLVWLDPAGDVNAGGVDDATAALVNDLDLVLVAPDGTTRFLPWTGDAQNPAAGATRHAANHVDPTEVVSVDGADNVWTGNWTLRVSGTIASGDVQAYALASSEPIGAAPVPVLGSPRYVVAEARIGAASPGVVVPLRNLGAGVLAFSIEAGPAWLGAQPPSGSAPADVLLEFDPAQLELGEHHATISIASDDPSGPKRVAVSVLVLPCVPDCAGRVCGADPACGQSCGGCARQELCDHGVCAEDPCRDVDCGACGVCSGGECIDAAEGAACDDADPCTRDDRCSAAACIGDGACDAGVTEWDARVPSGADGGGVPADAGAPRRDAHARAAGCACSVVVGAGDAQFDAAWLWLTALAVALRRGRREPPRSLARRADKLGQQRFE